MEPKLRCDNDEFEGRVAADETTKVFESNHPVFISVDSNILIKNEPAVDIEYDKEEMNTVQTNVAVNSFSANDKANIEVWVYLSIRHDVSMAVYVLI